MTRRMSPAARMSPDEIKVVYATAAERIERFGQAVRDLVEKNPFPREVDTASRQTD